MTQALSALAAGALLALGASGCASWHSGSAHEAGTYGTGVTMNTTTAPAQGNRNALMATVDDQVSRDIEQALHAANGIDARDITVRSMNGHVELNGTVRSDAERQRAIEVARNTDVEHVVDVRDNLRVAS
ncbi:MAG TPA: BON domain-containing protein [Usitatibacter sp.]|nr:BON domain-containing protein [Usitatibacter sp.]